jgi:hypothetical protein
MRASLARNGGQLTATGPAGVRDPHARRVRAGPGDAGRARARREAPRGAGADVPAGRRGRLRGPGPGRPARTAHHRTGQPAPTVHIGHPRSPTPPARRSTVFGTIRETQERVGRGGRRVLHHLHDAGRRRPAGAVVAGPRGRARRRTRRAGPDRVRPAAGDDRGAGQRRPAARPGAQHRAVPHGRTRPRRRAGGDARLLGLQQGGRHHDVAVEHPPRAACAARRGRPARRAVAALPRAGAARSGAAADPRTRRSWRSRSAR